MTNSTNLINQFSLYKSKKFLPFFVTQFLGALNDNLFKNALLVIIVSSALHTADSTINFLTNFAVGLFILPFFLFSATAGQLADRFDKAFLMRRVKFFEILIMILGAVSLIYQNLTSMLCVLFLLGTQSAFFGPLKYSIIPQHLSSKELLAGNAQVGMGTFVSILLGTLIGGWVITINSGEIILGFLMLLMALVGWISSQKIPPAPSENDKVENSFNPIREAKLNFNLASENNSVWYCILAISWFWLYGGCFLTQVPNFTVSVLHGHPRMVSILLAAFIIGIATGALLCNRLSKGVVNPALVTLGTLGLSTFAFDLSYASSVFADNNAHLNKIMPLEFLTLEGSIRLTLDLILIGIFGGLFIVPLNAMVQSRTSTAVRARVISANNIINAAFMVGGSLLGIVFLTILGWSILEFFIAIAVLNILFMAYIFSKVPEFKSSFLNWISKSAQNSKPD